MNDEQSHLSPTAPVLGIGQSIAFAVLTMSFWLTTHPYAGLWHDSIIYTAQALNMLYPEIYQGDIFFKYGSQADFTVFPTLHALLIKQIGVDDSALLLTIVGQVLFFTGAISLARHFLTREQTLLFLILFATLPVYENPILRIFEVFATSRSISAGLSLLVLVFFLKNRAIIASSLLIIALLLHPLMPLGVVAITLFLQRPKFIFFFISTGVISFCIGYALAIPPFSFLAREIDPVWRELVAGHALFLFIEHWKSADFNLLVLEVCAILSARAYSTRKLRLIFNALLLATTACLVASIAGSWLSNALLIEIQTWRILLFVHIFSAIALAWLFSVAWTKEYGKVTILLYIANYLSFNSIGGLPALAIHLFWIWSLKRNPTIPPLLVKGAYIVLAQGVFWYLLSTKFSSPLTIGFSPVFKFFNHISFSLRASPFYITALLIVLLLYGKRSPKVFTIYLATAVLIVAPISIYYFDQRFRNITWDSGNSEPYISLRKEIPENATVYCEAGLHTAWFLIRRQHYMAGYQAAGNIFNKTKAFETKRRADLVLNAGFSDGLRSRYGHDFINHTLPEPTTASFDAMCQDPVLDYIITTDEFVHKKADKIIDTDGNKIYIYYCSPLAIKHKTL